MTSGAIGSRAYESNFTFHVPLWPTKGRIAALLLALQIIPFWPGGVGSCGAAAPGMMSFQGRVTVSQTNFSGAGRFKFALVDAGVLFPRPFPLPPIHIFQTYWSHDGTSTNGSAPLSYVTLDVSQGLYSVMLGHTGVANMTQTIPSTVFTNTEVFLRVWFDDGSHGFQLLSPDLRVGSVAYALQAGGVDAGVITTEMIADQAITGTKIKSGSLSADQIRAGAEADYVSFSQATGAFASTNPVAFADLSWFPSSGSSFTFALENGPVGRVLGFTGRESISEPYEFVVVVSLPAPELDPDRQIGRPASVTFARPQKASRFAGIVSGCSMSADGKEARYVFRIQAPLSYLAFSTDYRVYQNLSAPDIAASVYSRRATNTLTTALVGSYAPRESTIQYAETELNFFQRLLEDQGIFYFFRVDQEVPVLVLGDSNAAFPPAPGSRLPYFGDGVGTDPGTECIGRFGRSARESTLKSLVSSYNFRTPSVDLLGSRSAIFGGAGEAYQFGSSADTVGGNTTLAKVRAEREAVKWAAIAGAASSADIRAGYTFRLADETGSGLDGTYLVTAARHAGFWRSTNGVPGFYYGNEFEAIPIAVPFRPELKSPKPVVPSCGAVVTGPAGEWRPFPDSWGRVKVQFHWDRYGSRNENSSAWLRVAGPMAGQTHGMLFLPRVGDEVLVQFLQGDPDQPVINGSLFNGVNNVPVPLPAARAVSLITSGSTNSIRHEIKFDDTPGNQLFSLQATRDFELHVENDLAASIGRDLTVSAPGILRLNFQQAVVAAPGGIGIGTSPDPLLALNIGGTVAATAFRGDGSGLANIPAGSVVAGTLDDARLSLNVARLNADQTFTGTNVFSTNVGVGGPIGAAALNVSGDVRINDKDILLRGGSNRTQGLGWRGAGKPFAGDISDGPVLYGSARGALGTTFRGENVAMSWDWTGNIWPSRQVCLGNDSSVYLGGNGVDHSMELKASRFYFNTGSLGLGLTNPVYQLQLSTDSAAKPNGGSWANSSDARLKKNIVPLEGALDRLCLLQGITFEWRNPEDHANQSGSQAGFLAQDVERVFPGWVSEVPGGSNDRNLTPDGRVKSLSLPFEFDALVVESIKELKEQNEVLRERNQELERAMLELRTAVDVLLQKGRR